MKLRGRLSPGVGLLLLSALWALDWLVPDLFPHFGTEGVSLPVGQAILFFGFAGVSASIAVVRGMEFLRGRYGWAGAGVGVGLFVIPTWAAAFARGRVSEFDGVAIFCLTPVFAVVLEPYLQNGPPHRGKGALAGCFVAIAGVLCIFPLETPGSFHAAAALCALLMAALGAAAANCIAVRIASREAGRSVCPMAAQAAAASALGFGLMAVVVPRAIWSTTALEVFLPRLFLVDVPGLVLLFWLMTRMAASRMTARFLLAPLLASVAGLALERMLPPVLLLAAGSGWLVFAPAESEGDGRISLRVVPAAPPARPMTQD